MDINPYIEQLRKWCPVFEDRVAGAQELSALIDDEPRLMALPCAYVVPTDTVGAEPASLCRYNQTLTESFDVVVAIDTGDLRGQAAVASLKTVRGQVFAALLGWKPDDDYGETSFDRGGVALMNRSRSLYRYTFKTEFTIGGRRPAGAPPEVWQHVVEDGLQPLDTVHINVDLQPMDGAIDAQLQVNNLSSS